MHAPHSLMLAGAPAVLALVPHSVMLADEGAPAALAPAPHSVMLADGGAPIFEMTFMRFENFLGMPRSNVWS
jgi:hypothetical protein